MLLYELYCTRIGPGKNTPVHLDSRLHDGVQKQQRTPLDCGTQKYVEQLDGRTWPLGTTIDSGKVSW